MKQLIQKQYKKSTVIYADGGRMIQKYGGGGAGGGTGGGGGGAWGSSDDDWKTWAKNQGFYQPLASSVWKRTRKDGTKERIGSNERMKKAYESSMKKTLARTLTVSSEDLSNYNAGLWKANPNQNPMTESLYRAAYIKAAKEKFGDGYININETARTKAYFRNWNKYKQLAGNATKMLYINGTWVNVNNTDKINNTDQNTDIINSSVASTSSTSPYTLNPEWNDNDISQFLLFVNDWNNLPELNKIYDLGNYGTNKDGIDGKWGKNTATAYNALKDEYENYNKWYLNNPGGNVAQWRALKTAQVPLNDLIQVPLNDLIQVPNTANTQLPPQQLSEAQKNTQLIIDSGRFDRRNMRNALNSGENASIMFNGQERDIREVLKEHGYVRDNGTIKRRGLKFLERELGKQSSLNFKTSSLNNGNASSGIKMNTTTPTINFDINLVKNPTTQIPVKKEDDIIKGTGLYGYNKAFKQGGILIKKHKFSKF